MLAPTSERIIISEINLSSALKAALKGTGECLRNLNVKILMVMEKFLRSAERHSEVGRNLGLKVFSRLETSSLCKNVKSAC